MNDLSLEFKSKLQKLFIEKKFSILEFELEYLRNIENLSRNIKYSYAIFSSLFDNKNFASIFSKKIKIIWENFIKG